MLIIPEIKTVVILVPRTASGSIYRTVLDFYPKAFMPYRHMEADGVPAGYDRWPKVGLVRHPLMRLRSLYMFLQTAEFRDHSPTYRTAMRSSVNMPFDRWLIENETTFTSPYDRTDGMEYHPFYSVRHALPETRKSQYIYLRPDLGTEVFRFSHMEEFYRRLGISPIRELKQNATGVVHNPHYETMAAAEHMYRFFSWDYDNA